MCGKPPIRKPGGHKWFAPLETFPADVYPDYLSGTAYLMSASAMRSLLDAAKQSM